MIFKEVIKQNIKYVFESFSDELTTRELIKNLPEKKRKMIILVGPPSVGKSTWIKSNLPDAYIINRDDLVVLLINTTKCFSGIDVRTKVTGRIIPQQGMSGVIGFTTPNVYVDTIVELL